MNGSEKNFKIDIGTAERDLRGRQDFGIPGAARFSHLHILGQTGTGKSTLLQNMLMDDFEFGHGVALLDPHGDLAESALALLPKHRADDLVYFNPADRTRPIGFNLLGDVRRDLRPVVASGVVAAFRHVWADSWGPRLDYIFENALLALMDVKKSTLLYLPRFLTDDAFRRTCLYEVHDPVVRHYWEAEYAAYPDRFREEAIAPVLNKVGKLLMMPALRNIIAQPNSTIDLRYMMDHKRILIANLSKGRLGEKVAHLMGAFLVTSLAQAAMARADMPENSRVPFYLYADEFQNFATESFAVILSEARKYKLSLTLAHQYLSQLPLPLRDAVFGNTGSHIVFRCSADDANVLAPQMGIAKPGDLRELANFEAMVTCLEHGRPCTPFKLNPYSEPDPVNGRVDRLKGHSALRFGRPRKMVEDHIAGFFKSRNLLG